MLIARAFPEIMVKLSVKYANNPKKNQMSQLKTFTCGRIIEVMQT